MNMEGLSSNGRVLHMVDRGIAHPQLRLCPPIFLNYLSPLAPTRFWSYLMTGVFVDETRMQPGPALFCLWDPFRSYDEELFS